MSTEDGLRNDELQDFVLQLYRLFKVGSLHLPNNESIIRTCEQTVKKFRALENLGSNRLSILFLQDTVFLNGRLLKADRNTYECAVEIARYLNRIGYNELVIEKPARTEDIQRIAAAFHSGWDREYNAGYTKLRRIDPDVLATLMDTESDPVAKLGRTYAQAVVVMRYVYEALRERRIVAPRNLKRLMQQFVLLANEDLESFTALARMRNPHDDDAGHAVKSALVAMGIVRLITSDLRVLARIGLATLLYDVGRPRATYIGLGPDAPMHRVLPLLHADQMRRLPASTGVTVTAISRLHPDAIHRSISIYNGQLWDLARQLGRDFDPDLESVILSMSWRFVRAMAFDVRTQLALTPAQAYTWLASTATPPAERIFCELLGHTLLLRAEAQVPAHVPTGAALRPDAAPTASSGPSAAVAAGPESPARYQAPQRITEVLQPARTTGSFPQPASPRRADVVEPSVERLAPRATSTGSLRPVAVQQAETRPSQERTVAMPSAAAAIRRPATGAQPSLRDATGSQPAIPVRPGTGSQPAIPVRPGTGSQPAIPVRPGTGSQPAIPVRPTTGAHAAPSPRQPTDAHAAVRQGAQSPATRVVTSEQSAQLLRNFASTTPAQQALGPNAPRPPAPAPSEGAQATRVVTGDQSARLLANFAQRTPAQQALGPNAPRPHAAAPPEGAQATRVVTGEQSISLLQSFVAAAPSAPAAPAAPAAQPPDEPPTRPGEAGSTRVVTGEQSARLLERFLTNAPSAARATAATPPASPAARTPSPSEAQDAAEESTRAVGAGDARALLDRFRTSARPSSPSSSPESVPSDWEATPSAIRRRPTRTQPTPPVPDDDKG